MDNAGLNLRQPDPINWEQHDKGSNYQPPPPALGPDGKEIIYTGVLTQPAVPDVTDEGFRKYVMGPIKIIKSGNGADGYLLKFFEPSVKLFSNGKQSKVSLLLRSAGIMGQPQTNAEYDAALAQIKPGSRPFQFTIDWEARNKDTGEQIRGYKNFPDDPQRPGYKKAILHAGDTYTDANGTQQVVKSDVLFANGRIAFPRTPRKSQ